MLSFLYEEASGSEVRLNPTAVYPVKVSLWMRASTEMLVYVSLLSHLLLQQNRSVLNKTKQVKFQVKITMFGEIYVQLYRSHAATHPPTLLLCSLSVFICNLKSWYLLLIIRV